MNLLCNLSLLGYPFVPNSALGYPFVPNSAHFGSLFRDFFGSDSLHSRTECEFLKITLVKHMLFGAN